MKTSLLIFLFFVSLSNLEAAYTKTNKSHSLSNKEYSFYFKLRGIQMRDSKLGKKRSGHRNFKGILKNKTPYNFEWISFKISFKDPNFNNGRYIIVSEEVVKNIPKKADIPFQIYIPVGEIDGRDFMVEISSYKKINFIA